MPGGSPCSKVRLKASIKPYEGVSRREALDATVRGSCGVWALGGPLPGSSFLLLSLLLLSRWRELLVGTLASFPELGKLPRLAVIMRSSICEARKGFGGLVRGGRASADGGLPGDCRMTEVGTEVAVGAGDDTTGGVGAGEGVEDGGGGAGVTESDVETGVGVDAEDVRAADAEGDEEMVNGMDGVPGLSLPVSMWLDILRSTAPGSCDALRGFNVRWPWICRLSRKRVLAVTGLFAGHSGHTSVSRKRRRYSSADWVRILESS